MTIATPQSENGMSAVFSVDFAGPTQTLTHAWEHTIGSGHATLALRADYQRQLARCRRELGFRYVRFHGLLCDDMGTFLIYIDKPLYSFFNADQIFDFLLSIGMKPFVELSFMPTGLSSGDKIAFHYRANVTAPRDYAMWGTLIGTLAEHWIERYGAEEVRQWFFEVWNEPNLDAFGSGLQADYFKLYKTTADALKAVDLHLKVGGPATADNAWIPDFLNFCATSKAAVDFVSTHHYPTDAFGKPGDDTEAQLAASRRSVLRDEAKQAKTEANGKPLYYTEWSTSSNPRDELHDMPYAAAFAVKTVLEADGLVEAYSYWTFSDIFEENYFPSVPFHGGFGLLNIHGIPKPIYRAYELLHKVGSDLLPTEGAHPTVDVWAVKGTTALSIVMTNFNLPRHPLAPERVKVSVRNISEPKRVIIERVDDDHANAPAAWKEMGKPNYLSHSQVETLMTASEVQIYDQPYTYADRCFTFEVDLKPLAVAVVTIDLQQNGK